MAKNLISRKPRGVGRQWLLAGCFLIAGLLVTGQFVSTINLLRGGARRVHVPISVMTASRMLGVIDSPYYRWDILAIDGQPFRGADQSLDLPEGRKAGDQVTLSMRGPQGERKDLVLTAQSQPIEGPHYLSLVVTYLFLPAFCFLPGFAVAIRPRDPLAWLLLALLLSFGETFMGPCGMGRGKISRGLCMDFSAIRGRAAVSG